MAQVNEVVRKNFSKVAEWIKTTFPHAIESSFEQGIKCNSCHHVYHTAYITIYQGEVYFNRGSHGNGTSTTTYSDKDKCWYENGRDVSNHRSDVCLEEFMHEWRSQKPYIEMTLQPYEDMYNFEV